MSDEFTKERDGVRRAPPSEIAWPKQASDERRSVAGASAGLPMLPATSGVRALYLFALFTAFAPRPGSSWVGLAVGGGWLAVLGWSALAIAAVAVWRGVTVLLYRHRLTAPAPTGSARWLRIFGIVLMAVGVVVYVLHFFIGPLGRLIYPGRTDSDIQFFIVGVWLSMFGGWGATGVLLFEFSRLMGFERTVALKETST